MKTKCSTCNKELSLKPSRIKRLKNKRITCSVKCSKVQKSIYYSGRNNPNTKFKNLDDNFFKNINSDKAYLLGWIASDGSIRSNNITIAMHKKDKKQLIELKNIICKDLEIKNKNITMVYFTINSKSIVNDVCKYLCIKPGKKFLDVKLPKLKNKKLIWSFIRGFFDGDGSIPTPSIKHKIRCNISTNSTQLLDSISEFAKIKNYNNKKDKIEFYGKNAIKFLKLLYKGSGEKNRLLRKYKMFKLLLSIS